MFKKKKREGQLTIGIWCEQEGYISLVSGDDFEKRVQSVKRLLKDGTFYDRLAQESWNEHGENAFEFHLLSGGDKK